MRGKKKKKIFSESLRSNVLILCGFYNMMQHEAKCSEHFSQALSRATNNNVFSFNPISEKEKIWQETFHFLGQSHGTYHHS